VVAVVAMERGALGGGIEGVGVFGDLGALLRLLLLLGGVGHGAAAREGVILGALRGDRISGGDEERRRDGERPVRRVTVDEAVELL